MSVQELIQRMMSPKGVPVTDKTYGFTRYKRCGSHDAPVAPHTPRCFTGTDTVKWLMANSIARTEGEAMTIGRAFLAKGL